MTETREVNGVGWMGKGKVKRRRRRTQGAHVKIEETFYSLIKKKMEEQ